MYCSLSVWSASFKQCKNNKIFRSGFFGSPTKIKGGSESPRSFCRLAQKWFFGNCQVLFIYVNMLFGKYLICDFLMMMMMKNMRSDEISFIIVAVGLFHSSWGLLVIDIKVYPIYFLIFDPKNHITAFCTSCVYIKKYIVWILILG